MKKKVFITHAKRSAITNFGGSLRSLGPVDIGTQVLKSILDQTIGITKLRGIWHLYKDKNIEIPALPVFHPAYLLRRPANKAFAMTDMLNFKNKIIEMKIDIKS